MEPIESTRPWRDDFLQHQDASRNDYMDHTLKVSRGVVYEGADVRERVRLSPDERMCSSRDSDPRVGGYLHFSIPTTVAEEAAWQVLQEEHAVPSVVVSSLLRPATLRGGPLVGVGVVVKKGQQVLSARGEAWQGGKKVAEVAVTFVRFERR